MKVDEWTGFTRHFAHLKSGDLVTALTWTNNSWPPKTAKTVFQGRQANGLSSCSAAVSVGSFQEHQGFALPRSSLVSESVPRTASGRALDTNIQAFIRKSHSSPQEPFQGFCIPNKYTPRPEKRSYQGQLTKRNNLTHHPHRYPVGERGTRFLIFRLVGQE